MTEAYSLRLRDIAKEAAIGLGNNLHEGVYAALLGPCYETPAEIRYLRTIGADLVGMSTAAEAIAANHAGIEVLGISCVTNVAAGLGEGKLDHQEVLDDGKLSAAFFTALLQAVVPALANLVNGRHLVLSDIDGTLMRGAGPHHKEALIEGALRVTGIRCTLDGIDTSGRLDRDLITAMLLNGGLSKRKIARSLTQIMEAVQHHYSVHCRTDLSAKICPGVRETLEFRHERCPNGFGHGKSQRHCLAQARKRRHSPSLLFWRFC